MCLNGAEICSLLKHVRVASGTLYVAIDLLDTVFSISTDIEDGQEFSFTWERKQYTLTSFFQDCVHYPVLILRELSYLHRESDHLDTL